MAEGSNEKGEDGGWWGSWINVAKEKSKAALEMVQKDLAEYTCTMSTDTSKAVAKTSDKLKETLKAENTSMAKDRFKTGVTSFLEGLSKALVIEAEDKEEPVATPIRSEAVYDRAKARLHAIQVDPETYCSEPSGSKERYQEWQKSFDIDKYKGEVSELLVSKVELRAFYTKLVPAEISHADFWKRYFYKVHQLQQDEARKLALMKRAEQAQKKEDSISWEDDWSGDEESTLEKVSRKQELSVRLSPAEKTETTENIPVSGNRSTHENQVSHPHQETDKETPHEIKQKTVDLPQVEEDSSVAEPPAEENLKQSVEEEHINERETVPESENQDSEITSPSPSDVTNVQEMASIVKDSTSDQSEPDMPEKEVKTKDKGDIVLVNPDRVTPSSDSNKENSTDDDWERDFDVELTEEELKAADEIAKKLNLSAADYTTIAGEMDEDWESWE
ncbi:BSD domain-containing protein 1-like [Crassostrea angulata]|uniref:BSD domain-containing protein 1-like n=1 Tax=Magallana angulata TaxID=2784310 RepID=UPI0022B18939|nr:BSD domain-containing protein 1-like [Crassostrea angulata]